MEIWTIIHDSSLLIITLCGVVISYLLYSCTRKNLEMQEMLNQEMIRMQREHNVKSLQPILHIVCKEIGNSIEINIKNCGLGTMIIKGMSVKNRNTSNKIYDYLYEIFPESIKINSYSVDVINRPIAVNESITLINIKDIKEENVAGIKNILCQHLVGVIYEDVYQNSYREEKNLFDIFGVTHRRQN